MQILYPEDSNSLNENIKVEEHVFKQNRENADGARSVSRSVSKSVATPPKEIKMKKVESNFNTDKIDDESTISLSQDLKEN